VCGYVGLEYQPRHPVSGGGSYEICPSCGFQFGVHDDDRRISYEEWRARWVSGGMKWNAKSIPPPEDWNPEKQLERVNQPSGGDMFDTP
jgi:hypothetical protein